jgi:hypothetical protein
MNARALLLLACAPVLRASGPFSGVSSPGAAAGDPWQPSAKAELWGYGSAMDRAPHLPGTQWTGETRADLRLARDGVEAVLRPLLFEQHSPDGFPDLNEGYLSQAYGRIRLDGGLTFTGGRELLTWGPGNFRSPSNPFYFDAGRTDPMREVPGVDLARVTWTQGPVTAMAAREWDSGRMDRSSTPQPVSLGKLDLRGRESLASVIVAHSVWGAPFYGGFAQASLGEAWLVYGEIGSGLRAQDPARRTTSLLGATYTLANGQTLGLEWLRDGHRVPLQPAAPGAGGGLSGRDHAALLWQSNLQETGHYWRLMWTCNLQDRSGQVLAYGEKNLSPRWTAFASATRNLGGTDSEYGAAFRTALTLGVKCFVF